MHTAENPARSTREPLTAENRMAKLEAEMKIVLADISAMRALMRGDAA